MIAQRVEQLTPMRVGDRSVDLRTHPCRLRQPYGCLSTTGHRKGRALYGRIEATSSGHRLTFVRDLAAPVDRVWEMLTDRAARATWLFDGEIEPRVGGAVDLFDEDHQMTGVVTTWEPPHRLALTWSSPDAPAGDVRFDLAATAEGRCRLTVTHSVAPGGRPRSLAAGWHTILDRLAPGRETPGFHELVAVYAERPIEDPDRE